MPASFVIEPAEKPAPNAPNVTELSEGAQAPAPAAEPKKPASKAKPAMDAAGVDQFLKGALGNDRYKDVAEKAKLAADSAKAGAGEEVEDPPKRGADGKFLKPAKVEKKVEKKPAVHPKPAPFKPQARPAAAPMTSEQVVAAAAEGAARAIAAGTKASKEQGDAATKAKEPELPPDEKDKIEVLSKMEELNPTKYKGIAAKYKTGLTALETYATEWEKDHPGQKFEKDSPEHEDFFKQNDVDWSDLDFQKAIARLVSDDAGKGAKAEIDQQLAELKRAETLREKQGEIVSEQNVAALQYWQQLGDSTSDVVKPDGTLNMEKVNELKEADPEAWAAQVAAAQDLDVEVAEIYKLFTGLTKNEPDKNPIHYNINQFAATKERELASKTIQEKFNAAGQVFVPASQFYRMTKVEQAQHWTYSARDLAVMRADDLAKTTQKRVDLTEEAHKRWAKARGIQLEDPDEKPASPSSGGESRMAAVADGAPKKVFTAGQNFLERQLRGS